jgi:hypothetical protein
MAKTIQKKNNKSVNKGKSINKKDNKPSPKGLGYPAHLEKINKVMPGKNGEKWIVKKRENGSLYWAPFEFTKTRSTFKAAMRKLNRKTKK